MPTTRYFALLDGLRGVAALAVVFHHFASWTGSDTEIAPRGYLAVDFFFCLSGFIITQAYARRVLGPMTFAKFVLARLVRLYPMALVSVGVSALYLLCKTALGVEPVSFSSLGYALLSGMALFPYPDAPVALGGPELFPLNAPLWSLFLELIVNFVWAAVLPWLSPRRSLGLAGIAFAVLAYGGYLHGDLALGHTTATMYWGIPRVTASFFLGTVLHHWMSTRNLSLAGNPALLTALFLGSLVLPRSGGGYLVDLALVMFLYPALVMAGASTQTHSKTTEACRALGTLSYPLYLLHYPLFCWLNGAVSTLIDIPHDDLRLHLLFAALIVPVAWAAEKAFDRPARAYLAQLLQSRAPEKESAAAGRARLPSNT